MKLRILVLLALVASARPASAEVVLQYFGTTWNEIERRIPELAERGYDALWLPPPFKGGAGTYSVGFDTFDRFDLGDRDGSGTIRTKYGTKADLFSMMRTAHRFGFRVYFDNVMAHNAGPLDKNTNPGNFFPGIPGFVPEDFHIVREGNGTWRKPADWPNWQDEWQVLNRNPFAWDIANEHPQNISFNPNGTAEAYTYPKWSGIRHPGQHQWYLDTDLVVGTNQANEPVHPFANKEPFQDVGYAPGNTGANNGKFDWNDANSNGQHDSGETSEPFTDTGVDPTVSWRQTTQWGFGDGKYNMGNIVAEDVNAMLYRSVRWFIDQASPDGFRLDAVKHVPSGFFGKQTGSDKDYVNWGYNGQIQEQFNITRGFSDWNNHRDSNFNTGIARDDAFLYGEHLGSPPGEGGYLDAGMRIANDNLLNTVKNGMGNSLAGYDQVNHGAWGNPGTGMNYVMSHDNNYLWSGDRPLAHAYILTREGHPIIYTDGYNQAGAPDWFPKPSGVNFLGQFGDNSVISAVAVHRDFARGTQIARYSDQNYTAYERVDNREKRKNTAWNGSVMVFMMARAYQAHGQGRLFPTGFPVGATLWNYSSHGGRFPVYVNNSTQIVNSPNGSNPPLAPPGGWFAFGWHTPNLPVVWQAARHQQQVAPITIEQNGQPVAMMDDWRVDGRDGDAGYNPYGVPAGDTANRAYRVKIPRVTDGTNLRFVARADGTAGNILMRLNGGVDLNSQMGLGPTTGAKRDFAPGLNSDQLDAASTTDTVLQASTDTYLGYEQMRFVRRKTEKFAAQPPPTPLPGASPEPRRNVIGSLGAETYQAVIGTAGFAINNATGQDATGTGITPWVEHAPATAREGSAQLQMNPAPQSAAGQSIDLWVRVGYSFQADRIWVYYTTNGTNYPEGHDGIGKGTTQVVQAGYVYNGAADGGGTPDWYKATLPAMPSGTVLRYKIGAVGPGTLPPRFPFSENDTKFAERAETIFEVANFNAETVGYHVHNDYGKMATGLEEGYHVLNTRAFVNRTDGASIFRTQTQVFYYDTEKPSGLVRYPNQNDTLGGSTYGCVALSDASVTQVQFYIDDLDPGNDDPAKGNGLYNWKDATLASTPTNLGTTGMAKEWRFDYENIPNAGTANIVVRFKEASSSGNNALSDIDGWFTTITRAVNTGSSINFNIGIPTTTGEIVDKNYVMRVYFKKELIPLGMSDNDFLNEFSIFISSTISGQPDNPVLQPRTSYVLNRDVNGTEHSVAYTFPNLYNGNPDFLHFVRVVHQRGSLTLSDTEKVRMKLDESSDSDGDGLPDFWERKYGFDPTNGTGRHGPKGDDDGDGHGNLDEFLAEMNPLEQDAWRYPRMTISPNPGWPGEWRLQFPSIPNRRYTIGYSDNLQNWSRWDGSMNTTGQPANPVNTWIDNGWSTEPDPQTVPRRFYRLEFSLP
ncbi:MAG: alpha-amylase family glycosyl hydrolase [Verrucomicrobiales bacterium]